MSELLSICVTRNRPHRIKEMLQSFKDTESSGDIFIYLQEDDPTLGDYDVKEYDHIIGERLYLSEAINKVALSIKPGYRYYQIIDDDMIYRTKNWDKVLIGTLEEKGGGWGIAFGRDIATDNNWHEHHHPTAPIIPKKNIDVLGHVLTPALRHFRLDTYLRTLYEGIDRFFRVPEVVIEHKHLWTDPKLRDVNYNTVYGEEYVQFGEKNYTLWVQNCKDQEIRKLNEAIANDLSVKK